MSKVRFFRTQNKITQLELAEQSSMTATELSLVENDKLLRNTITVQIIKTAVKGVVGA